MNKRKQCAEETLKRVSVNVSLHVHSRWHMGKLNKIIRVWMIFPGEERILSLTDSLPFLGLFHNFIFVWNMITLLSFVFIICLEFFSKRNQMSSCCLKGTLPTQYITQKNAWLSQIHKCTHTFMGLLVMYKLGIELSDKSLIYICIYMHI